MEVEATSIDVKKLKGKLENGIAVIFIPEKENRTSRRNWILETPSSPAENRTSQRNWILETQSSPAQVQGVDYDVMTRFYASYLGENADFIELWNSVQLTEDKKGRGMSQESVDTRVTNSIRAVEEQVDKDLQKIQKAKDPSIFKDMFGIEAPGNYQIDLIKLKAQLEGVVPLIFIPATPKERNSRNHWTLYANDVSENRDFVRQETELRNAFKAFKTFPPANSPTNVKSTNDEGTNKSVSAVSADKDVSVQASKADADVFDLSDFTTPKTYSETHFVPPPEAPRILHTDTFPPQNLDVDDIAPNKLQQKYRALAMEWVLTKRRYNNSSFKKFKEFWDSHSEGTREQLLQKQLERDVNNPNSPVFGKLARYEHDTFLHYAYAVADTE
eukprot:Filipodium_phascolosomae@DN665_c0_g1_i1.p1